MNQTAIKNRVISQLPPQLRDYAAVTHTQFGAHVIVRKGELKSNIILNNPIQVLKDDFKIAHLISVGEL